MISPPRRVEDVFEVSLPCKLAVGRVIASHVFDSCCCCCCCCCCFSRLLFRVCTDWSGYLFLACGTCTLRVCAHFGYFSLLCCACVLCVLCVSSYGLFLSRLSHVYSCPYSNVVLLVFAPACCMCALCSFCAINIIVFSFLLSPPRDRPGLMQELCNMMIECCSQERTWLPYYGLIAQRFCMMHRRWQGAFAESFETNYNTIHRSVTPQRRRGYPHDRFAAATRIPLLFQSVGLQPL